MLCLFAEIVICFFAVLGIYFSATRFFDCYTAKRSGIRAKITVFGIDNCKNAEYAIRILACQIAHSPMCGIIHSVEINQSATDDCELIDRLSCEFKNIKKDE